MFKYLTSCEVIECPINKIGHSIIIQYIYIFSNNTDLMGDDVKWKSAKQKWLFLIEFKCFFSSDGIHSNNYFSILSQNPLEYLHNLSLNV